MKRSLPIGRAANAHRRRNIVAALSTCALGLACSSSGGDTVELRVDPSASAPPESPAASEPEGAADAVAPAASPEPTQAWVSPDLQAAVSALGRDLTALDLQALEILTGCSQCHSGPEALGGIADLGNLGTLLQSGEIVAGDPDASPVYARMQRGDMPPGSAFTEERPSSGDIALLRSWIQTLPTADASCQPLPVMGYDKAYRLMRADLMQQPAEAQPFIRYFGINAASNQGFCGQVLDTQRFALFKLINGLSLNPTVTAPIAVDTAQLVFRIDIRNYAWDEAVDVAFAPYVAPGTSGIGGAAQFYTRTLNDDAVAHFGNKWDALVAGAGEYAVPFRGPDADEVTRATGSAVPFLPAGAFIQAAAVGDLYYQMVDAPTDFTALQTRFAMGAVPGSSGAAANWAAFVTGVGRNEMLAGRAASNGNALWTLDRVTAGESLNRTFLGESLFTAPLDTNPSLGIRQAIYSLPNGLQAYFQAAPDGKRLAVAGGFLVDDPSADSVTWANVSFGFASCNSCHQAGVLPVTDQIRDYVLGDATHFDDTTRDRVARVYPPEPVMDSLRRSDQERYLGALRAAGVPPNAADGVLPAFLDFQNGVTYRAALGELGVSEALFDAVLPALDPSLLPLASGNRLGRVDFTRVFRSALCSLSAAADNKPLGCE
jgi:hypothetical protein